MWKNRLRKINDWLHKGSSEMIGFVLMLPIMLVLCFGLIMIVQMGLTRQSLEHAVYAGARAAVVCDNEEAGRANAESAVRSVLSEATFGIDASDAKIDIELAGGTTNPLLTSAFMSNIAWEKGALLGCTVTVPITPILSFGASEMDSTLYMMVEKPVPTYN